VIALARGLARRPASLARGLGVSMQALSPSGAIALAVIATACVALGDELTGPDVSFTVLYLGPIAFATWFVSSPAGIVLSAASAVASLASDFASRATPLPTTIAAWNLAVQLGTFFALVLLLSALKARLVFEQQLARTDPLTLVSNRRAFVEQAGVELERSRRTGKPITVAYLDCDDFKIINDLLGHAQGDALLCNVATTLRGGTRAIDCVARLGGDEFGLLLVDADGGTAETLIQRLRTALATATYQEGWAVSFSIGAAIFVTPPRSVDDMLRHADRLMYDAKRSGKNAARLEVVGAQPAVSTLEA
jgi:diguanylate cyclase (GGDEF)-like protein